jgi:hypothetical protein
MKISARNGTGRKITLTSPEAEADKPLGQEFKASLTYHFGPTAPAAAQ